MRWDALFTDLEAQAAALEVRDRAVEVGDRTRIEVGTLSVLDRLRAATGTAVRVAVGGGIAVAGVVSRVGADWVLLDEGSGREALVAHPALRSVAGLGRYSAVPGSGGAVLARLTLRSALRGIASDRSAVRLHTVDGDMLAATVDRVGLDFVEVARHPAGEARRRSEVRDVVLVPVAALAVIRREVW